MNSNDYLLEIIKLAEPLEVGQQSYLNKCPKCGDTTNERALALHKTHSHVKFFCFRATCGYKGIVDHRTGTQLKADPKKEKGTTYKYTKPFRMLNPDEYKFLAQKYEVFALGGIRYGTNDNRFLLPIRGLYQKHLGWVGRAYPEYAQDAISKAINYRENDSEPFLHFPYKPRKNPIVVVEDWWSAEKIAQESHQTVALLGTNLTEQMVLQFVDYGIDKLILALDRNAWQKYLVYKNKFGGILNIQGKVWESGKDPKDMSIPEIHSVFG